MKFYILDDRPSALKTMTDIVEKLELGEVIGGNTNAIKGEAEIIAKHPDIVLIDLLMPEKDGISIVKDVLSELPDISFIMISQVVDKEMISDAYNAGIEFFITKPNNVIECENVIKRVIEKREMASVISGIRSVMGTAETKAEARDVAAPEPHREKRILGALGMLGETGTNDIITVMEELKKSGKTYDSKGSLNRYAEFLGEDPKIVKQRIRRAIKKGLTNIASIGVEDSYHDTFVEYAHTLFNFDSVRSEMDLIRGKSAYGGKPSIDTFFEGLEMLTE